ncbi:hypothetical protein [Thermoflavimicrobium dichotomicum]|uniref:Uncharacterized protein n=1 Tax=Thermoflavimicrobium dichotomicum TaxID=46223 RepID=A0A1I3QRW1_9BACL|nr:hypothetical protein [Thermoflavimicrobium dichotomicum]SFJ36818.1 hypothetical protein SAMN05421852_10876 [Thermoflavimicrobium dichotomicum]
MSKRVRNLFLFGLIMIFSLFVWVEKSKANIMVKSSPLQMEPEKLEVTPIPLK